MAEKLGYANVNRMLEDMTAAQVIEWAAYYEIRAWEQKEGRSAPTRK